MKMLVVTGSPLWVLNGTYYSKDSWVLFPLKMSDYFTKIVIWGPQKEVNSILELPETVFKIELKFNIVIVKHDYYNTFIGHYKLLLKKYFVWTEITNKYVSESDVVVLRLPSPMVSFLKKAIRKNPKKMVVFSLSDLKKSDRVVRSSGMKKILYSIMANILVKQEIAAVKRAQVVFAYSKILLKRYVDLEGVNAILSRDPIISEEDFYYRDDTCSKKTINLLRVSWLQPLKGLETLIDAVSLLRTDGFNVFLKVVGDERESGYRDKLLSKIEAYSLGNYISLDGWVPYDKMGEIYINSDIQVITSLTEGMPRCIAEGGARGVPLVTTPVGGIGDHFKHKKQAYFVEVNNADSVAKGIVEVIENRSLRKRLIKEGYVYAENSTFETLGQKVIETIIDA
jgi:glycosyltransferase involved in cell wall biosynthesis